MAVNVFGTNSISGLNVRVGAHLIEDHELQESVNGWTDQDGVWSVAPRPNRVYTGTDIVAYATGRMGGADHHVWIDGTTLYDNGTSAGTVTGATSDMSIHPIDDAFLILGAPKNWLWDGTHLREQGAWQPDYLHSVNEAYTSALTQTITAITEAAQCVITMTSNVFVPGDRVYIDSGSDMTELNSRYFTVTASTIGASGTITLDEDSSGHTTWTAGGTVKPAADLVGDYKFFLVTCIRLTDGTVLTSEPRGLMVERILTYSAAIDEHYDLGPTDQAEASTLSLSAGETVQLGQGHGSPLAYFRVYFARGGTNLFGIGGTAGADYYRGIRIYRTKANGYDVYKEREYFEGDANVSTFTDANGSGIQMPNMYMGTPDYQLGAVLDYEINEHISAPASDLSAFVGQRVFLAVADKLWWSTLDGPEYYTETGNTEMFDTIEALGEYQDYCVVFSADRIWAVRLIDGIPDIEEIRTPVGTVWPKAMKQTSAGLLFLRPDGLYAFAGGEVAKISRGAFSALTSPQCVVQAGDILYLSGSEKAYVSINRGGSWVWHESSHVYPYADQTSGNLYSADGTTINSLFTGVRTAGRLVTKAFGSLDLSMTYKVELDIEGDTIPKVWGNGNVISDTAWHADDTLYSFPGRRIIWAWMPKILSHYVNVEVEVTGECKVCGVRGLQER